MKRLITICAIVLFNVGYTGAETWTTFNAPGATATAAYGISGNNVVGWYIDSSGKTHGFLYNGTTWTTLDKSGATSTAAYSIDSNKIVGVYTDTAYKPFGFFL